MNLFEFSSPVGGSNSAALQSEALTSGTSAMSAQTLTNPGSNTPSALNTPQVYQGKRYQLTSLKTWEEAQAEALGLGGHLVAINNAAEEAWLQATFGQDETFWLGLSDEAEEGSFRWVTGEPLTYQNWAAGQPDNHPNIEREDYGALNFRGGSQWNDASALATYRGIIEIPMDVNTSKEVPVQKQVSIQKVPISPDATESRGEIGTLSETGTSGETESLKLYDVTGTWEPYRFWGEENFSVVSEPQAKLLSRSSSDDPLLRISMPAGSASPAVTQQQGRPLGGGEFLGHLRQDSVERLRLRYDLRFSEDFDFVKGGKLPGLYGGTAPSGGNIPDGTDGFSTRFMWREAGEGEVYAYLPDSQRYGTSIGRGQWAFTPGVWHTLEQEVILNDPAQANGQLRVWLDGKVAFSATNLQFRTAETLKINGIYISSFFGGGGVEYATPKDVHIDFANFAVWEPS